MTSIENKPITPGECDINFADIPCQACGKPVRVTVPFYGCVFCSECGHGSSYESADAKEFKGLEE